jgi:hypothetical protein
MQRETCRFSDETHLAEEERREETHTPTGFAEACGTGNDGVA